MNNPSAYARAFVDNGVSSVPIIDTHAHMGPVYGTSLSIASAEEMVRTMDRENIEMIWCAPHSALFDPAARDSELEAAMRAYPGRIRGYFAYNPNYPEEALPHIEDVLHIPGYIGFKLLPEYHHYAVTGPAYGPVLELADAHKRVVLIHTWGGSPFNAPQHVEQVLKRYPGIVLIMGHSAPGECDRAIGLARDYPNAYLDLCDIHRHNGIIDRMAAGAGADKILFGTDIPWYDPNYCLGSILFSRLGDEDKYKIIRGNASRILQAL